MVGPVTRSKSDRSFNSRNTLSSSLPSNKQSREGKGSRKQGKSSKTKNAESSSSSRGRRRVEKRMRKSSKTSKDRTGTRSSSRGREGLQRESSESEDEEEAQDVRLDGLDEPIPLPKGDERQLPQVKNVVANFEVSERLDLLDISRKTANSEYKRYRTRGGQKLIVRIQEPKTTATIFATGKVVLMGSKSIKQSRLASRKFVKILRDCGTTARLADFKINNVMATASTGFHLNLHRFSIRRFNEKERCSYEPEIYPGAVYRRSKPNVTVLVFANGKMVFMGANNHEDVNVTFENLEKQLKHYSI